MIRPVKEPRKRSTKHYERLLKKLASSKRFASLVEVLRHAACEHLASATDIRQAASLVVHERDWQLYAIKQGHVPQPESVVDDEDDEFCDEEGDEECPG